MRLWLFRMLAVLLVPLLCVAVVESGLRLLSYGHPTRFLVSQRLEGKEVLAPNLRFGWRFFGAAQARQPAPFLLAKEKPAKTIRIFVFGESAAYGDPQPDFGLPRMLQAMLRLRYPGIEFEVVNAAMTGINSHAVLEIARDCTQAQGDIWVIYMGNNEVVGPYGPGTIFGRQAAPLPFIRASLAFKSTRLGQLINQAQTRLHPLPEGLEDWGGMQMFLEHRLRQDDPRMERVYASFSRNLESLIELGLRHQIGLVLSTVAVNLKDCAPFASAHRADLSQEAREKWENIFSRGVAQETARSWQEATQLYAQAAAIDDRYAELHFRWARCCLAMGKAEDAQRHFARSRDLDTLRFRCDSRLNEMIRQTAKRQAERGLRLADSEAAFARESPQGIAGREYLLEHVHPAFEGNYLLALTLAREIEVLLPESIRQVSNASPPWPTLEACARQLAYAGWARYQTATEILARLYDPPFTQQINHAEQLERWTGELERLRPELRAPALLQSEALCQSALAIAPKDGVLYSHLARIRQHLGNLPGALEAARREVDLNPLNSAAWQHLGLLLMQQQKYDEAVPSFEEAIRIDPDNFWAMEKLGRCQAFLGHSSEALKTYRRAIALKPRFGPAHLGLGRTLETLGRLSEAQASYQRAIQHRIHRKPELLELMEFCRLKGWHQAALTNCLEALRMNPGDASAHLSAGQILTALNRAPEAQRHFTEAARLDPGLAPARFLAGLQLGRQGNAAAAAEHFQDVIRLMPELAEARLNLGIALVKLGRTDEARAQFEMVLKQQPTNAVALREIQALNNRRDPNSVDRQ